MQVQEDNLKFKAKIFRALSDPVRLEILRFLRDGEKCVCIITPHVNLIQPLVSRHLKILKERARATLKCCFPKYSVCCFSRKL